MFCITTSVMRKIPALTQLMMVNHPKICTQDLSVITTSMKRATRILSYTSIKKKLIITRMKISNYL